MEPDVTQKHSDILIGGGGFAGLVLSIALRQALGSSFIVSVADPILEKNIQDMRASAIAAAARRIFEAIGVWQEIAEHAEPIREMAITDSKLQDAVRPIFLTFAGEAEPGEIFAHMVENCYVMSALIKKAKADGVIFLPTSVISHNVFSNCIEVQLNNGCCFSAKLLVAADGARSRIRENAAIQSFGWVYGQTAIVTTVAHERAHGGRADEHFLPSGPFAILPLTGNRSSIVWTENSDEAERIQNLSDDDFHAELEKRFGLRLGEIKVIGPRRAFPLGFSVAREFISERIALVGDAAHVIHPIAGQGLNMGLRDVAALAEAIVDSVRLGLDPGSTHVLDRYQQWRRFDTMAMGIATDSLNRLFSNHSDTLRLARDIGLGLVDRMPLLKNIFIREAAGLTGNLPKLMRGELP